MNADRILDRLWKAERAESNTHLRADYRQAWICVSFASKGNADPFVLSSYQCYGLHPDNVFPHWLAEQKARLGAEFSAWYDQAGNLKPDVPGKKPARLWNVLMFPKAV